MNRHPQTTLLLAAALGQLTHHARRDAMSDPLLVELTGTAERQESGIQLPLLCSAQVQHAYVRWTARDNRRQGWQDTAGRRWDLCCLLARALRIHIAQANAAGRFIQSGQSMPFTFFAVPRDGVSREPVRVTLLCHFHTDADGVPLLIVTERDEPAPWHAAA